MTERIKTTTSAKPIKFELSNVAFPVIRRVWPALLYSDLVNIQPMNAPAGAVYFLDFLFPPSDSNDEEVIP